MNFVISLQYDCAFLVRYAVKNRSHKWHNVLKKRILFGIIDSLYYKEIYV